MAELYQLIAIELLGKMTNAEGARLNALLQEDWARKEWDAFHAQLQDTDITDKLASLLQRDAQAETNAHLKQKGYTRLVVGGIVLMVIAAVAYMLATRNR